MPYYYYYYYYYNALIIACIQSSKQFQSRENGESKTKRFKGRKGDYYFCLNFFFFLTFISYLKNLSKSEQEKEEETRFEQRPAQRKRRSVVRLNRVAGDLNVRQ